MVIIRLTVRHVIIQETALQRKGERMMNDFLIGACTGVSIIFLVNVFFDVIKFVYKMNIIRKHRRINDVEISPIDDNSDISLIYFVDGKPHCRIHGAMNCNKVLKNGDRMYRCFSSYAYKREDMHLPIEQRSFTDRTCESACIVLKEEN